MVNVVSSDDTDIFRSNTIITFVQFEVYKMQEGIE